MAVRAFGAAAVSLSLVLLPAVPGRAQSSAAASPAASAPAPPPPMIGFVPPYEIMKTVRAAGFAPLAPPLREGTTYVLRATDFRGVLMRVVVDARTGAIRDANRIVAGPDTPDDALSLMPQPYYGPLPPYGTGVRVYDGPDVEPASVPDDAAQPVIQPLSRLSVPSAPRSNLAVPPPLPRPRPATLASRKPDAPSSVRSAAPQPDPPPATNAAASTATATDPPAATGAPKKAKGPAAQFND